MASTSHEQPTLANQIRLYELAQTIAHVDHWEWCDKSGRLTLSSGLASLMGCSEADRLESMGGLMRFIHPEDRGRVELAVEAARLSGQPQEVAYKLRPPVGKGVPVTSTILAVGGKESGCVLGVIKYGDQGGSSCAEALGQSGRDELTGLQTRCSFTAQLASALEASEKSSHFAVVLLNVNQFKRINAGFGPEVGDDLLKGIAKRLYRLSMEAEIPARIGGDEFAVVLSGVEPGALVERVEALASQMREPFTVGGRTVHVAIRVGYSLYPTHGVSAGDLIRKAEISLHQSASDGGRQASGYKPGASERAQEQSYLEAGLREALLHQEIELFYQPQVCLTSGRIIGAEALMRWHHPELGLIPPDKFIPLAEESGLILDLGEWALHAVAKQAHDWKRLSPCFQRVAVNVSGIQLNSSNLLAIVNRVLAASAIDPTLLELELTESVVMHSSGKAAETLAQLHDRGISIAVDDFGTGYSSLAYLQKLPINKLKLDKSFIKDIATNPDDLAIARAIVGLGKSLRLTVMAEGVETQGQRDILEKEGCEQAQGYLYGRPMPAAELTTLLAEGNDLQAVPDLSHLTAPGRAK